MKPARIAYMRIASWNVNSLKARQPQLDRWLADAQPDVLGLQEIKLADASFPVRALEEAGWQTAWAGQKTYNGVAFMSRLPLADVDRGGELDDPEQRRVIAATVGDVRIINAYCVNGQAVGSDKYHFKLRWFERLERYVAQQLQQWPNLVLMGDFNIAPADIDVHDPELWYEQVLCSTPERAALKRLLDLGLHDSFRLKNDQPKQYSWWDYRELAFRRNRGLRIDLLLVSAPLIPRLSAVGIDKQPRTWEKPSDHAPVWIALDPA